MRDGELSLPTEKTGQTRRLAIARGYARRDRHAFGGSSVAKILVADDNSNIQKMVGLALKDHGIEVVAVGNGEAAVRKISDIRPDLVLADVFMPVRNGYEVCKYVKEDKTLSHIPVILLVGAFDPLDEQEAQKAGADGVLKKPFVPPDPLISMVKSALVRAGVAHAGFNPVKEAEPAEAPAAPDAAMAPKIAPPRLEVPTAVIPDDTESFVDEVPVKPVEFKIESGQQPVAFGNLLEAPGTSIEEEAPEFAAAPAGLDMDRDFRSSKEDEAEEEEEPSSKGSWRRDAGDEESFVDEGAATSRDFRGGKPGSWTPTRETEDLTEPVEAFDGVPAGMMDRRDMPTPPFAGEAWAAAIDNESHRKIAVAEEEHPTVNPADLEKLIGQSAEPVAASEPVMAEQSFVDESPAFTPEQKQVEVDSPAIPEPAAVAQEAQTTVEPAKTSETSSWFSTPPPNPWEDEAHKASRLASTWDSTEATSPASVRGARGDVSFEPTTAPDEIEVVPGANSEVAAAAAETVREEAAQAVEQVERQAEATASTPEAKEAILDAAAHFDMDSVVAKVLARLSPGLLHDATRDILKPVVEAVVREELNSRKQ
jgi:CheY-like chemotaxis protein